MRGTAATSFPFWRHSCRAPARPPRKPGRNQAKACVAKAIIVPAGRHLAPHARADQSTSEQAMFPSGTGGNGTGTHWAGCASGDARRGVGRGPPPTLACPMATSTTETRAVAAPCMRGSLRFYGRRRAPAPKKGTPEQNNGRTSRGRPGIISWTYPEHRRLREHQQGNKPTRRPRVGMSVSSRRAAPR
jgi:hypothetical protein